jgi:hypothetical protein
MLGLMFSRSFSNKVKLQMYFLTFGGFIRKKITIQFSMYLLAMGEWLISGNFSDKVCLCTKGNLWFSPEMLVYSTI